MYGLTPRISLESIRDQWSNQTPGYSFVSDPSKNLSSAYLALSSRVCLDSVSGVVKGDRWDVDAVRRYLREEENLLLKLSLLMILRSGQAPRTPELTSLECFNGPSTSRGVYVEKGSIAYVTRHWKPRQSTNQEFHVVRYLPPADSAVVACYLIYIRPFANMLSRQCCGRHKERSLLFATADNSNQPWKVGVLTAALKKLTQEVCNSAFGLQIYRQVSIAMTEKHVKQISRRFNRYDDKSAAADIEVAFAWQSGHRPLQRGTTYGIDSAFPDSLQPALLRVYRWASTEWHGFLRADEPLPPGQLPSLTTSQLRRQLSPRATKRRLLAEEINHSPSKYRRQPGRFSRSVSVISDPQSPQAQREMIELSESGTEAFIDTECTQSEVGTVSLNNGNVSPCSIRISSRKRGARDLQRASAIRPTNSSWLPRSEATFDAGKSEETEKCADSSIPTIILNIDSPLASNEDLKRLLFDTRKLCHQDYYWRHISGTPTRPIQGSCICYCPSLQVLLCLGCGRCLNPETYLQHLKRRHSIAYRQLDLSSLARLQQEIRNLPLNPLDEISIVGHNKHYFPDLPVTFNNFKCRDCPFVDVCRKGVRKHFNSNHRTLTVSVNRKVDYVLDKVPLQTFEGFANNRKLHFVPKLPEKLDTRILAVYEDVSK